MLEDSSDEKVNGSGTTCTQTADDVARCRLKQTRKKNSGTCEASWIAEASLNTSITR